MLPVRAYSRIGMIRGNAKGEVVRDV